MNEDLLISEARRIIGHMEELIREKQAERHESGLASRRNSPLMFKELPMDNQIASEILQLSERLSKAELRTHEHWRLRRLVLLFAALNMVRFVPRSSGFWDHFFRILRLEGSSTDYRRLFDWMWQGFGEAVDRSWFRKPESGMYDERLLVRSIYREAKTLRFRDIEKFWFIADYREEHRIGRISGV